MQDRIVIVPARFPPTFPVAMTMVGELKCSLTSEEAGPEDGTQDWDGPRIWVGSRRGGVGRKGTGLGPKRDRKGSERGRFRVRFSSLFHTPVSVSAGQAIACAAGTSPETFLGSICFAHR